MSGNQECLYRNFCLRNKIFQCKSENFDLLLVQEEKPHHPIIRMNLQQILQQDIQWLLRYFTLNQKCQPLWTIKNLGVTMDRALTPDQHVKLLIHSCFFQMSNIAKLWRIVSQAAIEMLIHALISFCLDYCKSLFTGLSQFLWIIYKWSEMLLLNCWSGPLKGVMSHQFRLLFSAH